MLGEPLEVLWFQFLDHPADWSPDDPFDFEIWAYVSVGDDSGACDYQIHLCSSARLPQIADKRHCYSIPQFKSRDDLIEELNSYIAKVCGNVAGDPYLELGRRWLWEYGRYDDRGRLIV